MPKYRNKDVYSLGISSNPSRGSNWCKRQNQNNLSLCLSLSIPLLLSPLLAKATTELGWKGK